jgi:tRNA nucleotidyltransferase (CCA-adding enzyme)
VAFRRVVEHERASPHRLADLAVRGDDLLALGFAPGPKLGEALRKLLHDVVEDPSLNTREELLARASKLDK